MILSVRDNRTASEALQRGGLFCVALAGSSSAAPVWNGSFDGPERLGRTPSYGGWSIHGATLRSGFLPVPSMRRSNGTCANPAKEEDGP